MSLLPFITIPANSSGRLSPEDLELFYDSWKNIMMINKDAQMAAAYKSVEVINK